MWPCRETYAANGMTKELERVKQEQDFLIDHLHQRLHEHQLAVEQYTAQLRGHEEVPAHLECLCLMAASALMPRVHLQQLETAVP